MTKINDATRVDELHEMFDIQFSKKPKPNVEKEEQISIKFE